MVHLFSPASPDVWATCDPLRLLKITINTTVLPSFHTFSYGVDAEASILPQVTSPVGIAYLSSKLRTDRENTVTMTFQTSVSGSRVIGIRPSNDIAFACKSIPPFHQHSLRQNTHQQTFVSVRARCALQQCLSHLSASCRQVRLVSFSR